MWFKKSSIKDLLPPPVRASHGEYSMILSAHDDPGSSTTELVDLSLQAISAAKKIDLSMLSQRLPCPPYFPNIWPGEHYKLLAGFTQILKPKLTLEIGTATGLSALAIKAFLPEKGKLITFDIKSWNSYPNTVLKEADFQDGSLQQIVADLSHPAIFDSYRPLLSQAEWIFIDATHDGHLEKTLLNLLSTLPFQKPPFILFDDIKVWTMLKMWREISLPKIDLTSFGHWSGTGLVQLI